MERNIVLGHELPVLHIVRILPPPLPLLGVLSCDADVSDGGVKPDIEHLALVAIQWDWGTPLEVSRDASLLETSLDPRLGNHSVTHS